jgi:hypothetical protein
MAVDVGGADVDEPGHTRLDGRIQQIPDAINVGFAERLPRPPVGGEGGAVVYAVHAADGPSQRLGVA